MIFDVFDEFFELRKIAREFETKRFMVDTQIKYQKEITEYRNKQKNLGVYPYEDYDDTEDIGILIGLVTAQRFLNM